MGRRVSRKTPHTSFIARGTAQGLPSVGCHSAVPVVGESRGAATPPRVGGDRHSPAWPVPGGYLPWRGPRETRRLAAAGLIESSRMPPGSGGGGYPAWPLPRPPRPRRKPRRRAAPCRGGPRRRGACAASRQPAGQPPTLQSFVCTPSRACRACRGQRPTALTRPPRGRRQVADCTGGAWTGIEAVDLGSVNEQTLVAEDDGGRSGGARASSRTTTGRAMPRRCSHAHRVPRRVGLIATRIGGA